VIPRWVIYTLLTLLAWGVWAVVFRLLDDTLSSAQSQALSTVGLLPVLLALFAVKETPVVENRRRGVLVALASGVVSCLGNIFYIEVLRGGHAATAIPLTSLYSLVTVLLAVPLLGERLNRVQVLGIAASLAAIYLFNVRDERELGPGRVVESLATIGLWGLAGFLQKVATNDISGRLSAIWFLIGFVPVGGWIIAREPLPASVSPQVWLLAAAFGFMLALGNLTILLAYASGGKASIVTPLAGLYFLVSLPIAIFGLGDRIVPRETLAVALAVVAVLALSMESSPDAPAGIETELPR
jgi:drug/metabolite transporter (DMT)-like permease